VCRFDTQQPLGTVYTAATRLSIAERLFLYTIERGARPQKVPEIGSKACNSASIIAAAIQRNGYRNIIALDSLG